jgi:hypothetical protein
MLTPAGPQAPELPAMLQRVTFFVASLKNLRVRECPFVRMAVLTHLVMPTVKPSVKTCLTQPS